MASSISSPWLTQTRSAAGLIGRDLYVLRHTLPSFIMRVVVQPALFIFVFAYVFPIVGQGIGGEKGSTLFSTLLVPGSIALAAFFNGIQAVSIPLIQDLGLTREIEDRIGAPVSLTMVAQTKIVAATIEGMIAGLIVFPVAVVLPSTGVNLDVNILAFVLALFLASWVGSAFGLLLGTILQPHQIPLMFSMIVVPLTFLGASYFPWVALDSAPILKGIVALNPMMYCNEFLRFAMSPTIPHIAPLWSCSIAIGWGILFTILGIATLRLRIQLG